MAEPRSRSVNEAARRACPDDVPHLARLCAEALEEVAAWRGGELFAASEARPAPYHESLTAAIHDDDHDVWVGTLDGEVFGYCVGRVSLLRDGRRLGVIEDLYVEPAARRVGVAAAMMHGILGWFETQRCAGVDASAMPGDRLTKNFFEAWGFTARRIVMHRGTDAAEPA